MSGKLDLPAAEIERCRALARTVAEGVRAETEQYTTVSTERTVLRLLGVDGVDADEVPIPNRVVDALQKAGRLSRGAAVWIGSAMAIGAADPSDAARRLIEAGGSVPEHPRWREAIAPHVERGLTRILANRAERERRVAAHPAEELPLLYAIVATGTSTKT